MEQVASEALVRRLYNSLLKREPDAGMAYHMRILNRSGDAGIAAVLEEMLGSPEFQRRTLDNLAKPHVSPPGSFKHVVSLGTHCYTAFLLKYAGMKSASYPFDWIFSSQAMVAHCLSDDFKEFIDPARMAENPLSEREHGAGYNKYHNTFYLDNFQVKYVFNHHDMSDQRNVTYFSRCVDRFRRLIRSNEDILLIQCTAEAPDNHELFQETCAILRSVAPSAALLLVSVSKPDPGAVMPGVSLESNNGHHRFYKLDPTSPWRGISFDAPIDDLAVLRLIENRGLDVRRSFSPWAVL